ncbi:N-6 DNA methylase [Pedosphaera parvula]|uniref:site-specific DNA-methyltransferase (adenine-specific) n=1 Tax=Pedosphaera parvula (strain Ellin514) TaxID=320771 RepID=B9XME0_PEDPL|nr:N-6 DNA methylase [Pedosphaera parvula]EEF58982.1 N-6 DNA methylase [Pedosphaera parvula Ellin514]
MLDSDTKRRIDTARNILVGKVPDPKSQVEQITIALIYKFMDDMDAESEELGGKRKFFTKDFARYGWARLMRSGLGGHELLGLYGEGIAKMPQNPGIPLLFREIFKNAYLPYRDPETLKAFLKIIDEFTYDHSERLGDAFEYLLSVLGSQGDAGQFRTPRHIIDFIVSVVDPKKNETVLDPACGTAGFLISSYKHILRANTDARGNSKLTPDDRGRLAKNFKGYDISPDMVRLSLVNLYLHGFTDPHIYEYDTLTSEERWNEFADVILANPPFMSPKGGIKPHKRFSVPSNRSEVLFVDYMLEHLTAHGRAGIIVPEGIIFQSGTAYRRLREVLLKESLIGIISLPSGVFQPYSGVKTSILILDKRVAKSRPHVLFSDIRAIGVSLGVKRTVTERNDLPFVVQDYAAYHEGTELSRHSFLVERNAIAANDYIFSAERYRPVEARAGTRVVRLKDVCSLTKGTHSSTKTQRGPYPLIVTAKEPLSSSDYEIDGEAVCVPMISSTGHGRATLSRIHFASGKFAVANLLAVLQPKDADVLITRFLYLVLDLQKDKVAELMKGAANVSMKVEDLAEFQIPLPSLATQKEIVLEIEGYQKVINGARAVLDHYRPHITIHPDWPICCLDDVASLRSGTTPDTTRGDYYVGDVNFVKTSEINNCIINSSVTHISREAVRDYGLTVFPKGTVLMAMYGQGKTRGQVAYLNVPACTTQNAAAITPNECVEPLYLYLYFLGQYDRLRKHGIDGHISHLNLTYLKTFEIPLPPLATQQAIVSEIEAEQALVAANRELITRFEKKIQATLARIWGEGDNTIETH